MMVGFGIGFRGNLKEVMGRLKVSFSKGKIEVEMGKPAGDKDKRPFLRKGSAERVYILGTAQRDSKEGEFSGERHSLEAPEQFYPLSCLSRIS